MSVNKTNKVKSGCINKALKTAEWTENVEVKGHVTKYEH